MYDMEKIKILCPFLVSVLSFSARSMKRFLIIFLLAFCAACFSQTGNKSYSFSDFEKFSSLFREEKAPVCSKSFLTREFMDSAIKLDSLFCINILKDKNLYYEDLILLNSMDDDVQITERVNFECFPRVMYKISNDAYSAFVVYKEKEEDYSGDTECWSKVYTFDTKGNFVDSMTVSGHDFRYSENLEMVFLSNNLFRLYHYKENPDAFVIRKNFFGYEGKEYLEGEPKSLCEITEYKISASGNIEKTGWKDVVLLKDIAYAYFRPEIIEDDPIKEYVK